MALSMFGCNNKTSSNPNTSYKAGTYEGTGSGMNGDVVVSVTFTDSEIKQIDVVKEEETDGLTDLVFEDVPNDIIQHQSLAVDGITGATFASNALIEAVKDAVTKAGGDVAALENKTIEVADKDLQLITKEADVVVVGGGCAGLAASVAAQDLGESVILIETNDYLGGNTVRSGGALIMYDGEAVSKVDTPMNESQIQEIHRILDMEFEDPTVQAWQEQVRKDSLPYLTGEKVGLFDSPEYASIHFYLVQNKQPKTDMLYDMTSDMKNVKDWMAEKGLNWTEKPAPIVGFGWPRCYFSKDHKGGNGYIEVLENTLNKGENCEIIRSCHGDTLLQENDRIVGVKATGKHGQPYEIKAKKGVILATGGFSANGELLKKYSTGLFDNIEKLKTDNDPSCVGDGLLMALDVGADTFHIGNYQCLPITDPKTGATITFAGTTTGLYINENGKRFIDETSDRDTMVKAILNQPNQCFYVISDKNNNGMDENGCNLMGVPLTSLLESGAVVSADTIEDLATKLEMDPAVLQETITTFNKAVVDGNDPEFGRISYEPDIINQGQSLEIKEGPFYACKRCPAAHITKGGILIDDSGRVIDTNGNHILGLYAAGEVTGGTEMKGMANGLYFGKLAGEAIVNDNK